MHCAAMGKDRMRLPLNGRIPIQAPFPEQRNHMVNQLNLLTKRVSEWLPYDIPFSDCFALRMPAPKADHTLLRTAGRLTYSVQAVTKDYALVAEDQDFNRLWLCHPKNLICRWLSQFAHSQSWSHLPLCTKSLVVSGTDYFMTTVYLEGLGII